jgi:hypothetical protein
MLNKWCSHRRLFFKISLMVLITSALPSATRKIIFSVPIGSPSNYFAMKKKRYFRNDFCEKIRNMNRWLLFSLFLLSCASPQIEKESLPSFFAIEKDSTCEFSMEDRKNLLSIANPENYPLTRYRKRPRSFPKETDCSHFVHFVFKEAGFPYHYRSSKDFPLAQEFEPISPRNALPGDVVLYRGHIGIISENYKVISATKNRKSIQELDAQFFSLTKKENTVFRYRCKNSLAKK